MKVKYIEQGESGRTCTECKNFESDNENEEAGKCFGYNVSARASCNLFEQK